MTSELNLKPGLIALGGLVLFLILVAGPLSFLSDRRAAKVTEKYTADTNQFITANTAGLKNLFTVIFAETDRCRRDRFENQSACQAKIQSAIFNTVALDSLKDSSSTLFIRYHENQLQKLGLNGALTNSDQIPELKSDEVIALLKGERSSLPWSDYFYDFSGSEVVVPVIIDGQIVGAIVRRVIE